MMRRGERVGGGGRSTQKRGFVYTQLTTMRSIAWAGDLRGWRTASRWAAAYNSASFITEMQVVLRGFSDSSLQSCIDNAVRSKMVFDGLVGGHSSVYVWGSSTVFSPREIHSTLCWRAPDSPD
jgi:hypothetical protein